MEVVQLLGLQGSGSTRCSGELAAREAGNIELKNGIATSVGQCVPVLLDCLFISSLRFSFILLQKH